VSPHLRWPFRAEAGGGCVDMSGVSPIRCGLVPFVDEPAAVGSGLKVIAAFD
jgi:hypothetical protein